MFKCYFIRLKELPEFCKKNKSKGLTINNLNKFVVRHFEDQALRQAQYKHSQG